MLKSYHVIWQSAIDVFRFFDPSPSSNSAGTASQHRFHRANRRCIRYMSPPTPPPAPCKAYSMFLCVIFTTSHLARAYAPGGSSCMILLDFRPTKQGFERCDMQRHTSSTEPIGLILAHTPPRMSLGRGVPIIPCIHAGVSKKP